MILSSAKLIRRNVIIVAWLRNLEPSSNCDHRTNLSENHRIQVCKPEKLFGLRSNSARLYSANSNKAVHPKVAKEPDNEDDKLREIFEPAKLTFRNGTDYKKTFHRLLELELDHALENKADGEAEKDLRKSFESELKALTKFEKNEGKLNSEIYQIILGKQKIARPKTKDQPLDLNAYRTPNSIRLNESQAFAIQQALENQFTLIQGRIKSKEFFIEESKCRSSSKIT